MKSSFLANVICFATLSFVICACGGSSTGVTELPSLSGLKYRVLDTGTLDTRSDESLSGSGNIIFNTALHGDQEANSTFKITFKLLEETSSLTLIANANKELKHGVEVEIKKKGISLAVVLADEAKSFFVSEETPLEEEVALHIDVHNGEEPDAHVIVESTTGKPLEEHIIAGQGKFWGLKLKNVEIIKVEVEEAEDHD